MTTVGVSGHQALPEPAAEYVENELRRLLEAASPLLGVTSLAAGADQLFAQVVLSKGGKLHVVVPCAGYESTFTSSVERGTFHRFLDCAANVERMPYLEPSEDAFLAAGHRVVDLSEWLIAVWDGAPARGKGGTADVVAYARDAGKRVDVVWPANTSR